MRCEDVRDRLPALARRELRDDEAAALRAHIAACDECADAWAVVEAVAAARPDAPRNLAGRVSAELTRRGAVAPKRTTRGWLGAAAFGAAAVLALIMLWPDGAAETEPRTLELAQEQAAAGDPFLDAGLFGATTPAEAELDGMIRVAALSDEVVLPVAAAAEVDTGVPALALDVGPALGDWPGADGMSAGVMLVEDLTYDEMQLLLEEMRT